MQTANILENEAITAAVQFGGGTYARKMLSKALRAYRAEGSMASATWLRNHVGFITGNLWKA